jgi:hypothetical protein
MKLLDVAVMLLWLLSAIFNVKGKAIPVTGHEGP